MQVLIVMSMVCISAVDPLSPQAAEYDIESPRAADEARLGRFLGALAGGAVGAAGSMAFVPLGGASPSTAGTWVSLAAPLLISLGAWSGYRIAGGQAGLLATAPGMVAGSLLSLLMLTATPGNARLEGYAPFIGGAFATLIGLAALSLDVRERQLVGRPIRHSAPAGRVALESAVPLAIALTTTAILAVTAPLAYGCSDSTCMVVQFAFAAATALGLAPTLWGVHRAMGGKGSLLAAFAGFGIAVAATAAAFGLAIASGSQLGTIRSNAAQVLLVSIPAAAGTMLSTVALEWSHTENSQDAQFTVGFAPTAGGAAISAGLRF